MRPRREVLLTTFADPSTFPSVIEKPAVEAPAAESAAVETPAVDAAEIETPAVETATTETPATEIPVAGVTAVETGTADVVTEAAEAEVAEPTMTFADLGLAPELVRVLAREGIITPFEIQAATMPDALAGRDVLGRGQTGSGKTLAFGLPLLTRVAKGGRAKPHHPKALILVPTRELAMQVADALMPLGRSVGVFIKTAVGGVPYDRQMDALRRGVEVIVATPGRLGDLIERGACSLDDVEVTVLDEADQMADMGFLPEVTELLAKTPAGTQRLLFSATLDGDVDALVRRFMTDPVTHSTNPAEASVSTMDHHLLLIPPHDKFPITASIANREGKTIVFARTQMGVDRLVEQLGAVGVRAGALHGGKTQRVRTRTLAEFKEGRTNVLVATDVAARGIHVDGISLVVHVDPPKDPKDYLHRAGRTARAGESGAVVTLVLPKQRRSTQAMMTKAGVAPSELRVRLGDEGLAQVTGAREPSGIPVPPEPEPRERGDRPRGRYADRPYSDRAPRSYGDRPQRSFGDRPQRTYGDRPATGAGTGGGYGDRPARTYADRPAGDRAPRTYADRPAGDRPQRSFDDRAPRSYGDRPTGERPTGDRPVGDRSTGGRPAGDKAGFAPRNGERTGGFRRDGGQRNDRGETGNRFGSPRPARSY
jgi:superfamily II DNA/RNA helicase